MTESATFAGVDKPEIAITNVNSRVKVIYDNDEPSNAMVTIRDQDGRIVFSEKIRKNAGFIRPYDLSKLPNGRYEVSVMNLDNNELTKKIVSNDIHEPEMLAHVNDIPGTENHYLLTVANQNNKLVTIEIFNEANDKLYHSQRRINDDYGCVFVMKNVPRHEQLTFYIKNDTASKFIRVN
jgi:hypothetical protein